MRTRNPDQRYRAVKKATQEPAEELEASLWRVMNAKGVEDDAVVFHAYEIYSVMLEREALQAWLIAYATEDEIRKWLRIPLEVVAAYKYLFFDVKIFRDELDIISWINEYDELNRGSENGHDLLMTAIREGVDKLAWMWGRGKAVMDPMVVQEKTMTDAFHRSRAHLGASISSKQALAAHGFMSTAVKVAQVLGKTGTPDVNSLVLKLKHREMTETIDEAVQAEEILH